ncbi:MAG TPA: ATP-binding cassette domain-containing protein [Actinomycetota bacterium]|nr:ATP-binding cassette domain-containing protein [Actinomycetota bacterium]
MIVTASNLHKTFGSTTAVDDLSFQVRPGQVTGFLGPNGSGKSTTLRLMLGLDHGRGMTLWDGKPLRLHRQAPKVVGAHLDARFFHPNRSARAHLRMLAAASRTKRKRVDEVIELMGLESVAGKRPKGFSLGMGQRLGLACAILAEPQVLLLDEPGNGLDPQSIHWLRDYLKHYAAQGRTVFVSSHLLSEMEIMADHLVVIARGRLLADESMSEFVDRSATNHVLVRSPRAAELEAAIAAELPTAEIRPEPPDGLAVTGVSTDQLGYIAFQHGLPVAELTRRTASLEQAFLELTRAGEDFRMGEPPAVPAPPAGPRAGQPPTGQPPAGQPPAGQPPAVQPPTGQPPAVQPPAGQPPTGQEGA